MDATVLIRGVTRPARARWEGQPRIASAQFRRAALHGSRLPVPGRRVRRGRTLAAGFILFLALLGSAVPATAQDPVKAAHSAEELRLLEKLRSLDAAMALPAPGDSLADSTVVSTVAGAPVTDSSAAGAAAPGSAPAVKGAPSADPAAGAVAVGAAADSGDAVAGVVAPAKGDARTAAADSTGTEEGPPGDADGALPGLGDGDGTRVLEILRGLEGYTVTEYQSDDARFDADSGIVELVGMAELARDGQTMTADSLLVFDQRAAVVCGYGQPVMSGPGNPVTSDQVCYDVEERMGVAIGARTKFAQNGEWFIHGERVYTRGTDRLYGRHTDFTSCDLEEPHYHFAAGSVKVVHDDVMVARNVTLNFGDVPVFWLPFMVQSLKQGRRSGLLTPRFGINDIVRQDSEYNRHISNVGFYWAINDYLGAEMALDWFSGNYTSLGGQLQFNWERQFLNGRFDFRRYWRQNGDTEFDVSGNGSWRLSERTSLQVRGDFASSSDFVQENTFDPTVLNREIAANASLSHRFDWGSLNLGGRRRQSLNDGRIDLNYPGASLTLSPMTLFMAPADDASWFNNMTWTGSANFDTRSTDADDTRSGASFRDQRAMDARVTSSLSLGRLSWSQSVSLDDQLDLAKSMIVDTVAVEGEGDAVRIDTFPALPSAATQRVDWNTSLSYQQRLIGTSTLTPRLSIRGQMLSSPLTGGERVSAPLRIDFGASVGTDLYGFWPGAGPFSAIRHRLSPSISYSYSPAPDPASITPVQDSVFGINLREQNRITLSLNQTFEAKYEVSDSAAAAADSAAAAAAAAPADPNGEPRRLPQARKIKLLGLSTSAIAYDFVRADEAIGPSSFWNGITQTRLTNTVSSDLLRGLSLSFSHELFEQATLESGEQGPRQFAPHLSNVNASFQLDSDSWLFRTLGLGNPPAEPAEPDSVPDDAIPAETLGAESGLLGGAGRIDRAEEPSGPAGSWTARFRYSLVRPRGEVDGNQMMQANLSFQPTENWRVTWNTGYSFTEHEFSDHVLRLTRDLHRWTANFDFRKAQNGNFMFQFFVQLKDNPDLKVDYNQRGGPTRR